MKKRYTKDIDFWIWMTKPNIEKLIEAIKAFGFNSLDLGLDTICTQQNICTQQTCGHVVANRVNFHIKQAPYPGTIPPYL